MATVPFVPTDKQRALAKLGGYDAPADPAQIDWNQFIQALMAIAALIAQLFGKKQAKPLMAAANCPAADQDMAACCLECAAAALDIATCQLSMAAACCDPAVPCFGPGAALTP